MSEFRIARLDCNGDTVATYDSLEAAEDFLRSNWSDRGNPGVIGGKWEHLQHLYRIVQWDEGEPGPTKAWRIDFETADLLEVDLSEIPVEPAGS